MKKFMSDAFAKFTSNILGKFLVALFFVALGLAAILGFFVFSEFIAKTFSVYGTLALVGLIISGYVTIEWNNSKYK